MRYIFFRHLHCQEIISITYFSLNEAYPKLFCKLRMFLNPKKLNLIWGFAIEIYVAFEVLYLVLAGQLCVRLIHFLSSKFNFVESNTLCSDLSSHVVYGFGQVPLARSTCGFESCWVTGVSLW